MDGECVFSGWLCASPTTCKVWGVLGPDLKRYFHFTQTFLMFCLQVQQIRQNASLRITQPLRWVCPQNEVKIWNFWPKSIKIWHMDPRMPQNRFGAT